jgi:photosystem II stability/assembly factor-like uncharacterized protein
MTGPRRTSILGGLALSAFVVVAAAGALVLGKRAAEGPNEQVAPPARGLPATPDYHSLYVDPDNPQRLLLGTHVGLYESRDSGVTWTTGPLEGDDAMNIVRAPNGALWVAGHNVLVRSNDGGRTWSDVRPTGLPHLDLHGFAVDRQGRLFAAAASQGLFVSTDGGSSFAKFSDEVGGGVYGLVADEGTILAAEPSRGLQRSEDDGKTWRVVLPAPVVRVASGPADVVLATGERIWRSEDRGVTWVEGFEPGPTFEPVAWSASEPNVVFTITPQTRTLFRSDDAGRSWKPVR